MLSDVLVLGWSTTIKMNCFDVCPTALLAVQSSSPAWCFLLKPTDTLVDSSHAHTLTPVDRCTNYRMYPHSRYQSDSIRLAKRSSESESRWLDRRVSEVDRWHRWNSVRLDRSKGELDGRERVFERDGGRATLHFESNLCVGTSDEILRPAEIITGVLDLQVVNSQWTIRKDLKTCK